MSDPYTPREMRLIAERDAMLSRLARVEEWTHVFGAALKPRGADTYGEGVRDAKAQVSLILRNDPHAVLTSDGSESIAWKTVAILGPKLSEVTQERDEAREQVRIIERDTTSAIADFVDSRLRMDRSNDAALFGIVNDIYSGAWKQGVSGC